MRMIISLCVNCNSIEVGEGRIGTTLLPETFLLELEQRGENYVKC